MNGERLNEKAILPQKEGYDLKFLGKRGWVYIK